LIAGMTRRVGGPVGGGVGVGVAVGGGVSVGVEDGDGVREGRGLESQERVAVGVEVVGRRLGVGRYSTRRVGVVVGVGVLVTTKDREAGSGKEASA